MIVDFEQDPSEPYGTGNFRDEQGRVMYLHDPETASQFNKTMRGAPLGQRVAEESTALATQQMGSAPERGPDQRLASVGTPPAAPKSRGQELVQSFEQTKASLAAPAVSAPTGGETTQDEEFLATPTGAEMDADAAPGAPTVGADPTTPAQQRIAQLVDATANAQPSAIAQRSQKGPPVLPKPHDPGGIPKSGVRSGETLSVDEGRPMENVQEELSSTNAAFAGKKGALEGAHLARVQTFETDTRSKQAQLSSEAYQEGTAAYQAQKQLREADANIARLNKAIADNDNAYDPERFVKRMSTGQKIGMVVLAALNGGFGSLIGKKDNDVLNIFRQMVNDDLEAQKLTLGSRGKALTSELERYRKMGLDAGQAEKLHRANQLKNVIGYSQLQAQLMNAPKEFQAQLDVALAELEKERVGVENGVLKEAEDKRSRAYQESQAHEVPPPVAGLSPQDVLALGQIRDKEIEAANAVEVSTAVGHPVTASEAQRIRNDASEYGKRQGQIGTTRNLLKRVAELAGLKEKNGAFSGEANAGWTGTEKRRQLEMAYTLLQRADIMNMTREPSQSLQERFAALTSRPFWDSDIRWQLNQLSAVLDAAQTELQGGYGNDVVRYYHRTPSPAQPAAAAPSRGVRKAPPAQRAAGNREQARTQQMLNDANKPSQADELDARDE